MPNNVNVLRGVKYSNLISNYRLLRTCGSRTFCRFQVSILARFNQESILYRCTYTLYERQPLYALGEAVARFFVAYPRGIISGVEVYTIY